jgi:hypothetical protein
LSARNITSFDLFYFQQLFKSRQKMMNITTYNS